MDLRGTIPIFFLTSDTHRANAMTDEYREKLKARLSPIHLYKLTPQTNCGECGFATCLAFSTQVIVGQGDLDACPYLDRKSVQPFRDRLDEQHRLGIGVKREGFEKALQFLREEVKKRPVRSIAESLGGTFEERDGLPALKLVYFGEEITVTPEDVSKRSGGEVNPWEKIFLYNYVIGNGAKPSGVYVGMESLPNSVSKIKSLKAHCEDRLAQAIVGRETRLSETVAGLGRELPLAGEKADCAAEFQILPNLSIRVFFWNEDLPEGFDAKTKFLFDSRVLNILDLESLIFACEQLTDRLIETLKA